MWTITGEPMLADVCWSLTGNLGLGGPGFTISGGRSDETSGFGDLVPQFNLRWNAGVHNFMTYVTGKHHGRRIRQNQSRQPRHRSQRDRRWFGYTYFDPTKGHEFSAVASFTYNFENDHTQYKNGVDFHLDWGASQFLSKQFLIGLVGYIYRQVSCDSGAGDRVGCFESRVFGVGPQIGYIIPLGEWQGYLNLKGYGEFGAENRPEGWNIWLTFAISPAAAPPARTSMIRK
jgi:Putative MetA-pathway of phenol degradation